MKALILTLTAVIALGGGAGAAATLYQSKAAGAGVGYAQQQLDDARWLVKFVGDGEASRDTVETYLMYRAAELTLKKGGDWFEASDAVSALKQAGPARGRPENGQGKLDYRWGWRPHWHFFQPGEIKSKNGPSEDGPIRGRFSELNRRYVASTEINIGKGPQPEGRRVFDARQLIAELNPKIVRPATQRPAD